MRPEQTRPLPHAYGERENVGQVICQREHSNLMAKKLKKQYKPVVTAFKGEASEGVLLVTQKKGIRKIFPENGMLEGGSNEQALWSAAVI